MEVDLEVVASVILFEDDCLPRRATVHVCEIQAMVLLAGAIDDQECACQLAENPHTRFTILNGENGSQDGLFPGKVLQAAIRDVSPKGGVFLHCVRFWLY